MCPYLLSDMVHVLHIQQPAFLQQNITLLIVTNQPTVSLNVFSLAQDRDLIKPCTAKSLHLKAFACKFPKIGDTHLKTIFVEEMTDNLQDICTVINE